MTTETEKKAATLYGEHALPLAIANLAEESARPIGGHSFGITKQGASAALRKLADTIDAGGAAPQKVSHSTHATGDDFVMHTVSVTFAAKRS